jgi:hypothetical protein
VPREPRLALDGGGAYYAESVAEAMNLATDPFSGLALAMRIRFLARARANQIGHAELKPGALGRLLLLGDRATGRTWSPSTEAISRAMSEARDRGWIGKESSRRCLVVPPSSASFGLGTAHCNAHRIRLRN